MVLLPSPAAMVQAATRIGRAKVTARPMRLPQVPLAAGPEPWSVALKLPLALAQSTGVRLQQRLTAQELGSP